MRLLLASRSPARRATLVSAGVTPLVRVSHVDEDAVLAGLARERGPFGGASPAEEVTALAVAKRDRVVEDLLAAPLPGIPEDEPLLVVGCDSMLEIGGRMVGKPGTPEIAVQRIREMRGRTAVLWTGHAVALVSPAAGSDRPDPDGASPATGRTVLGADARDASTRVVFGSMSDAEIDAYVATGEPLRVAGSFTIDGLGGPFVRGVEGDPHSVVGISLPLLRDMAADLGVFWPDLWDLNR
ncbi:Maf family protein [Actinomyces sp. B33]|uniref:Maf family protein n=1 Tax=Actinomyces sp. B33 TaxID=2942131 RepID=UPI0023425D9C|nr:nucleoside triphosphate pyrophosphatase [Actinomyces sp. B33]MDC4232620.1 Maf family protein [Actinomyces sp. B33]